MNQGEVLVKVDSVSKKFCKSLKRSLWYGVKDITFEIFGQQREKELRTNEFWAVDNVSFVLKRGECLGLIGHNGAGKSTLLKMLNGLIKPDKGRIEMKGRVGALIELGTGFNPILTGRENVYNNAAVLGFSRNYVDQKFDEILEFAEIGEFIDAPVQNYSSGMKVRLGFAVASHLNPDILIIDEVLAVGDVGFKAKCFNRITEMAKECAVIFVSHSMNQVSRICSEVALLNHGSIDLHQKGDFLEVIQKYYDLASMDNSVAFQDKRISDVQLYINNSDQELTIDEKTTLEFDLKLHFTETLKVSIFYIIMDADLRPVCQVPIKSEEMNILTVNGRVRISSVLESLPFNTGKYYVSLLIFDSEQSINRDWLYRHNSIFKFSLSRIEIGGVSMNSGCVLFPSSEIIE